jgi:hypothetical protein
LGIVALNSGCASIVKNFQDPEILELTSEPSGAAAEVEGYGPCTTPCNLAIDKNKDFSISVSKPGYNPLTYQTGSALNLWTLGNFLWGGLLGVAIGGAIDWYNNCLWKVSETEIFFELTAIHKSTTNGEKKSKGKNKSQDEDGEPMESQSDKKQSPQEPVSPNLLHEKNQSPQKTTVPAPPRVKPLTPREKAHIAEIIPASEVQSRLIQYYGNLSTASAKVYEERIYQQLRGMESEGHPLDLDEAIRRDWFLHKNSGK